MASVGDVERNCDETPPGVPSHEVEEEPVIARLIKMNSDETWYFDIEAVKPDGASVSDSKL